MRFIHKLALRPTAARVAGLDGLARVAGLRGFDHGQRQRP